MKINKVYGELYVEHIKNNGQKETTKRTINAKNINIEDKDKNSRDKSFSSHFGGYTLRFKNGTKISTQFFAGSYSDNHNRIEDFMKYREVSMFDYYHSDRVELAILDNDDNFITDKVLKYNNKYESELRAYVTFNEWIKILDKVKNYDRMVPFNSYIRKHYDKLVNSFKKIKNDIKKDWNKSIGKLKEYLRSILK